MGLDNSISCRYSETMKNTTRILNQCTILKEEKQTSSIRNTTIQETKGCWLQENITAGNDNRTF